MVHGLRANTEGDASDRELCQVTSASPPLGRVEGLASKAVTARRPPKVDTFRHTRHQRVQVRVPFSLVGITFASFFARVFIERARLSLPSLVRPRRLLMALLIERITHLALAPWRRTDRRGR